VSTEPSLFDPEEILGETEAHPAIKNLSSPQFKTGVGGQPVYSRAQGSQGYFFNQGHLSAFGTEHPVDKALGNARRLAGFRNAATGGHPGAAAVIQAASYGTMSAPRPSQYTVGATPAPEPVGGVTSA